MEGQTNGLKEWNRDSRNRPTHLWNLLSDKGTCRSVGKEGTQQMELTPTKGDTKKKLSIPSTEEGKNGEQLKFSHTTAGHVQV